MRKSVLILLLIFGCCLLPVQVRAGFDKDVIATAGGDLEITFIGHASLMLTYKDKVIQIDPSSREADYTKFPPADLILLTHHHSDHLDPAALAKVRTEKSELVLTELCAGEVEGGLVMKNGDERTVMGVGIRAVPAYNLVHRRDNGQVFHPRGEGNGYVLTFADQKVYIAGDSENTPEMKALEDIDYAFLPMNLPYTMTPEMVADAARAFKPKVLYPYHYGTTEVGRLLALLRDRPEIEVRVRKM
ncbi:MAG: MBL fold metallo-hydrolase [Desulfurivibrionaceae bacterium]